MIVAVVGATGLVGSKMLQVLQERNFPVTELLPVASERSWGKKVTFQGKEWTVMSASEAIARKPVLAIFSAGGAASAELAPQFAKIGCYVVDNSSYWRMDPSVPLVVPEINADVLTQDNHIIANPNCSTIQMVLPLAGSGTRRRLRHQISAPDRPERSAAHRLLPPGRLYQGGDEDGERNP